MIDWFNKINKLNDIYYNSNNLIKCANTHNIFFTNTIDEALDCISTTDDIDYPNIVIIDYSNSNNNIKLSNSSKLIYNVTSNYNLIKSIINKSNSNKVYFLLNITNDFLNNIDKFAKLMLKIKRYFNKTNSKYNFNNYSFYFSINKNLDTNDDIMKNVFNIYHLINSLNFENKKEMYEYVYDVCCNYLDYMFTKNSYCDFKNDTCIANRDKTTCHSSYGCCYYIAFNRRLTFKNKGVCPFQKNRKCEIKCLPCKLFTCKYYRKKGIQFTTKNVFLLKHIFNKKQKLVLTYNLYKDKDEIINKLLEKNSMPYFIYYLTLSYYINFPKL